MNEMLGTSKSIQRSVILARTFGGAIVFLNPAPATPTIDRTFLIDIEDASPRRVLAWMRYFDGDLSDEKIVEAFGQVDAKWDPISEPSAARPAGGVKTRVDLDITRSGKRDYARVVFRVRGADRFFDLAGNDASYAITAGDALSAKYLSGPRWIDPQQNGEHNIVGMLVRGVPTPADKFSAQYNLGIIVKDTGADYYTPIFLDPKIEDNGG